jgi:hypothetical protein
MVQDRPARIERRLSAILAADVAGYSRLMHHNEEGTHTKLTGAPCERCGARNSGPWRPHREEDRRWVLGRISERS